MPKIRFYIDKTNTDKEGFAPIKANVSIDYTDVSNSVGKIQPRYWNKKQKRVSPPRPHEKDNNYIKINSCLDDLENDSKKYFFDLNLKNIKITRELVKDYFKGTKVDLNQTKKDFWEAYDEFLKIGELEKAPNTIRNRKTIKNKLKQFESETGYKMTFQSINMVFFDRIKEWILDIKEHEYGYFPAIINKFKAFLTWSFDRDYHNNRAYKKFSAPEKEGSIIHLTYPELKNLVNFNFENKKHQRARDFFCFGCLTGLRYCDLERLTKDNIINDTIKLTTQKTEIEVIIPIIPEQQSIINRYPEPHKLLPKYSNQKLNKYIKECCKIAEINTLTEFKTFKKNLTKIEFKPKHELIGTHTARKTFINLMYSRGVPIETIKAITGITREKTLKRYLEVSADSKRENLILAFGGL